MKGGIYYPDQVAIFGSERYGGLDICGILDAIHEKGVYFNDEAVNPSRPSLYSRVLTYNESYSYGSRPGIGTEMSTDFLAGLDADWNYNVFAVYQFAIMSTGYPSYIPDFGANIPQMVLQASAGFSPVNKSISRTGYIGQRNVGTHGGPDGNVHMPYTLSDSFEWNVHALRDGGINVYMDMSFVDDPTDTSEYDVSYQARFLIVAGNKP